MTTQTNGDDCRESGAGETSREQFEAWIERIAISQLDAEAGLRECFTNMLYHAWVASRATIEITPPKFIDSREALSKGFMVDYSNGYGDAMDAYEERLKEAGITVKE